MLFATLPLVLLLAACTGDPPAGDPATVAALTPPATTPAARPSDPGPAPPPQPTSAPAATATSESPADVDPEFTLDSDGDAIPDWVEAELALPQCRLEGCDPATGVGAPPELLDENVLLILDSSGSMAGDDGSGRTKLDAAKEALTRYVLGTPDSFDLGLMVYGHVGSNSEADRPASCAGVETLAGLGEFNASTVDATLARFQPTGWTPIAGSLQASAQVFAGREGEPNRVILVTDGIETCDGDPVAAAQALHQSGVAVVIDVVGFDIPDSDAAALRAIAEVTGGTYTDAQTGAALQEYFDDLQRQRGELLEQMVCRLAGGDDYQICISTTAVDADIFLSRFALDLNSDDPRRAAIEQIRDDMRAYSDQVRAESRLIDETELERLRQEYEEARQRLIERFGEDAALAGWRCPYAEAEPLLV